jgi:hypothetical protein
MVNVHMLIGLGEGLITALIISAILKVRPELIPNVDSSVAGTPTPARGDVWIPGLLVALGLAIFVSPFACPWPDGLERVASRLGFEHHAQTAPFLNTPMAEYRIPGIGNPVLATALAGAIGTLLVFVLSWLLARWLSSRPAAPIKGEP